MKQTGKQLAIPLALIFNRSLRESEYPTAFKTSISTAIFKKGDECEVSNYRQVCMANSMSIIFEKIMNSQILSLIGNQITQYQHGFIKGKSTNTNLVEYVTHISSSLDMGYETHVIYTDFSKAFDTVDHNILLSKLKKMGIEDKLLLWLQSYLKNRQIYVTINGYKSQPFAPTSGALLSLTFS